VEADVLRILHLPASACAILSAWAGLSTGKVAP